MSQALYQRIAASLRQRILSGGHAAGDVMPSENELAGAYRTSRVTVRKAFHILESEGLVVAKQGKGYIVQPPRSTVYTLMFGEDAEGDRYRCLEVNIVPPEEEVARALSLREGQFVIAIRRVLERAGSPVAYDEKYIPYERGRPDVELELHFSEFPELFADRFVSAALRTELRILAVPPPERARNALGCGAEPLLTLEKRILSPEGEPIGFGREYLTGGYGALTAFSGPSPAE
jgi:GntR family transcriptional regulator